MGPFQRMKQNQVHTDGRTRILIADDQPSVRKGLALVVGLEEDMEIVGTATNGLGAVEMARLLNPDVILMDLEMPYLDGVEAARRIQEEHLPISIVLLVTQINAETMQRADAAGAFDVVEKVAPDTRIVQVIRAARRATADQSP